MYSSFKKYQSHNKQAKIQCKNWKLQALQKQSDSQRYV